MQNVESYELISRRIAQIIKEEVKLFKIDYLTKDDLKSSIKGEVEIVGKILLKEKKGDGREVPRVVINFHHKKKERLVVKDGKRTVSQTDFSEELSENRYNLEQIHHLPPQKEKVDGKQITLIPPTKPWYIHIKHIFKRSEPDVARVTELVDESEREFYAKRQRLRRDVGEREEGRIVWEDSAIVREVGEKMGDFIAKTTATSINFQTILLRMIDYKRIQSNYPQYTYDYSLEISIKLTTGRELSFTLFSQGADDLFDLFQLSIKTYK